MHFLLGDELKHVFSHEKTKHHLYTFSLFAPVLMSIAAFRPIFQLEHTQKMLSSILNTCKCADFYRILTFR